MSVDLESLKEAGLTEYESKAYIGLLRYGASKGGELAEKTDVARARIYDVLRSLGDKGLANKIQEDPVKYSPVEPETGLKSLYRQKIENLKFHEEKAIEDLKEVESQVEEPGIEESVNVVMGYDRMFSHVTQDYSQATDEILILSVGEEIPHKLKRQLKQLRERDVELRFIASKNDEENREILEEFQDYIGWKMRHYPTTQDYSLSVQDREKVMINVRNPENRDERISVFFEIEGLAEALADYFEQLWSEAGEVRFDE